MLHDTAQQTKAWLQNYSMDQRAERITSTRRSNPSKENHYQSTSLVLPSNRCRPHSPGFKLLYTTNYLSTDSFTTSLRKFYSYAFAAEIYFISLDTSKTKLTSEQN